MQLNIPPEPAAQVRGKIILEIDGPNLSILPIADTDMAADAVLTEFCRLLRDGAFLRAIERLS
jgi:hypothetical protein